MIDPLPSDIFQTDQVLNNTYEIQCVLGRGGTGEVYRAVNQVTGRVFAIKALNAQFSGKSDYIELMKREEEIRSISHDAVVRYNECSRTDNGHVILVMDYIAGPSLADAMESLRFDPKDLLIIAHRIAEGLVAAHSHGIVHRDISPDNIILRDGQPDQATLIDFGIAKDTAEGARTIVGNEFAGKYEYAAPEQLEGHADAKSDLYALGATILAIFRGETPFLGTTPGEIVRRKQGSLSTDGVPEPLKQLIDKLAAPDSSDRPESAEDAVEFITGLLKPRRRTEERKKPGDKKRRSLLPILFGGLGLAALLIVGFFLRGLIWPTLPTVSPFTLEASKAVNGRTFLVGHAPDEQGASTLVSAFTSTTNAPPEAANVMLANGVPADTWISEIAELMEELATVNSWQLNVSDMTVRVSGIAQNANAMRKLTSDLTEWDTRAALTLQHDLLAGPVTLTSDVVAAALDAVENCGPLETNGQEFGLGDTVAVSGRVANASDAEAIRQTVTPVIGSRTLDVNVRVLNEDLCSIRAVLPPAPGINVSVWLGNGSDGSANLTGIYSTGQNPIAEIQAPASLADGYLWVMIADNTGKVFHVLPNINNTEQRLSQLGSLEGGLRRIRVLHSVSDLQLDSSKLAVTVNEGDYGKSEIIAILSRTPLFDLRRPRDESIASASEALSEALAGRGSDILGIASRVIEARR